MQQKAMKRLEALIPSDEDRARALNSVSRFCEVYDPPHINNDGLNALISFAIENEYLEETKDILNINGLADGALQILFREYFKAFTKQHGQFIPTLSGDTLKSCTALCRQAQSCFPEKDSNAIVSWLYRKANWFIRITDKERIDRVVFLLVNDLKEFQYGGLRSIRLDDYTANKLLPLARFFGKLLSAMSEDEAKIIKTTATGQALEEALKAKGISAEELVASQDNPPGTSEPSKQQPAHEHEPTSMESSSVTHGIAEQPTVQQPATESEDASTKPSSESVGTAENSFGEHKDINPALDELIKAFVRFIHNEYGLDMEVRIKTT